MWQGSYVAIITPFDLDREVDIPALQELVEWHIQEGTEGIVCAGSTGEGIVLSDKEREIVAKGVIEQAKGRIPIVVGTGTADTRQSVHLTEMARNLGADGCLVVTPYYNKPNERGLVAHFTEIGKVGLPIIAYHNPARTSVRWNVQTFEALAKIKSVVGFKDSGRDLGELTECVERIEKPIFCGDDDLICEMIERGAVGSISVMGNLFPKKWKELVDCSLGKKEEKSKELLEAFLPLCRAIFLETNPQGVKWALQRMGKSNGILRLPLVEIGEEAKASIEKTLVLPSPEFNPAH